MRKTWTFNKWRGCKGNDGYSRKSYDDTFETYATLEEDVYLKGGRNDGEETIDYSML